MQYPLTKTEEKLLHMLDNYVEKYGYGPTCKEFAPYTKQHVSIYMQRLFAKGYVQRLKQLSRCWVLTPAGKDYLTKHDERAI